MATALTSCSNSLEAAVDKYAQIFARTVAETQSGGLDDSEEPLVAEAGRAMCESQAEADPDAFVDLWG